MDIDEVLAAHGIGQALGNATTADVLSGVTFSNIQGTNWTGAMPNNGSPTLQPGDSVALGYYAGGSVATPGNGNQTWSTPGSYTFTVPSGVTRIVAQIWSAGGGGGGGPGGTATAQVSYVGGGGGGGAYALAFVNVTPLGTVSISVGAGGAGGAGGAENADGSSGSTGGSSSVGAVSVAGGAPGTQGTQTASGVGGSGATAPTGQILAYDGAAGVSSLPPNGGDGPLIGGGTGGAGASAAGSAGSIGGLAAGGGGGAGGAAAGAGGSGGAGGNGQVIVNW